MAILAQAPESAEDAENAENAENEQPAAGTGIFPYRCTYHGTQMIATLEIVP